MKKYELHQHTYYSPCSNLKPKEILKLAKARNLEGIAITDHNTIKGALEIKSLNKNKNFEVIIGEEIKTDKGEVLAYYLTKEIKPGKFNTVIEQIRQQKAIAILAHPYTKGIFRKKAKISKKEILQLDGIEVLNRRNILKRDNKKAFKLAKILNKPMISGSDAHFKEEIGQNPTYLKLNLKHSIQNKLTFPSGNIKNALKNRTKSHFLIIKNILFSK